MTITAQGIGSGLDLEGLISSLVSAERDAKTSSFSSKTQDLNIQLSAVGAINSRVDAFKTSVDSLNDLEDFQNRTASITQPSIGDIISVSPGSSASTGRYQISVDQLAQGSRSESAASAFSSASDVVSAGGGNLTFTSGADDSFTLAVPAGATLEELRELINDDENNYGVSANLIDTGSDVRLVLTSSVTGAGNDLVVTNDDASLDAVSTGMTIKAGDEAKLARIFVDGLAIESDSNTFENVISGVDITALKESAGETASASISTDKEGVKSLIEGFVSNYNQMLSVFNEATQIGAALNGDSSIRNLEAQLSRSLMSQFDGLGDFETIFDIGIEMDNEGNLSIDSTKFNESLDSGYDDLAKMFAGEDGLATVVSGMLEPYTQTGGIFDKRTETVQEQIDDTAES
jgi:flagellar hook-associated protein 2